MKISPIEGKWKEQSLRVKHGCSLSNLSFHIYEVEVMSASPLPPSCWQMEMK